MTKPSRERMQAFLTAHLVVAEEIGSLAMDEMTPSIWNALCKINMRLLKLAGEEAEQLERTQ